MEIKPLEVTQNDIDKFLSVHGGLMRAYHMSYIGTANVFSKVDAWRGIYLSLRVQIERKSADSINPALTEAERAEWRKQAQESILNLCYVTIFHINTIDKATLTDICRILSMMRFQHPIGEALVEADLVFKDKVVSAIVAIGNRIKEL